MYITIPCGGLDPPYTCTKSGAVILVEKSDTFYTISQLCKRTNNSDGYYFHAIKNKCAIISTLHVHIIMLIT